MSIQRSAIAAISRCYPLLSGNFSLINYSKFSGIFARFKGLHWCNSPGGPLLVPLDDAVGRCIYFTGDYDRKITHLCRQLLQAGDVALDIGANLGVVTLAMAKFVGPSGRVHSFEPNPLMQRLLRQSIERSYRNVSLHNVALGSEDAEMSLYFSVENAGAGSLIKPRSSRGESVVCQVRRLDDIIIESDIERIRLIKIDVEGFEKEVLLGARATLTKLRPIIILETNDPVNIPFKQHPVIATLATHDYSFFAIPKALVSMRLVGVSQEENGPPSHDIVACPRELNSYLKFKNVL
jgi:FkbM family methyltransferase